MGAFGWVLAVCGSAVAVAVSGPVRGFPLYTVYNLEDLTSDIASAQIFETAEGQIALVGEGNFECFDGRKWDSRLVQSEFSSDSLFSAARDGTGRIYAGVTGSWGILESQRDGSFVFRSLIDRNEYRNLDSVRSDNYAGILALTEGAVFWGERSVVLHLPGEKNLVWGDFDRIWTVFESERQLYLSSEAGLFRLEGRDWLPANRGERMRGSRAVIAAAIGEGGDTLLATRMEGLFRLAHGALEPVSTAVDALLKEGVLAVESLPGGAIAISLEHEGIVILDADLRIDFFMPESEDTNFSGVRHLYYSEEGILWGTSPGGLLKIPYPSQLTVLDSRNGLSIKWPRGFLAGGRVGVYSDRRIYLEAREDERWATRFEPLVVDGTGQFQACGTAEDGFFAAGGERLWWVDPATNASALALEGAHITWVEVFDRYPGFAVAGSNERFHLLRRDASGRWAPTGVTRPAHGFVAVSCESREGDLWLEQGIGQVSRLVLDPGVPDLGVQRFAGSPLLDHRWLVVFEVEGDIYVRGGDRLARFDRAAATLVEAELPALLAPSFCATVARPSEDAGGRIWLPAEGQIILAGRDANGGFHYDFDAVRLLKNRNTTLRHLPNGDSFIQSENRLAFFDSSVSRPPQRESRPVISLVRLADGDEILYSVHEADGARELELPYASNSLRFEFFSPSYYRGRSPRFSTRLEGLTESWSAPIPEGSATFLKLREGRYRFQVRDESGMAPPSEVASFAFVVKPPFYRSLWAYLLYVVVGVLLVLLIVRSSLRSAVREQSRLSALVQARTGELLRLNEELKGAVKQAEAASEAKGQFLANMSHEIRTPLNGVIAMADTLRQTPLSREQDEMVEIINRSGGFLIRIISDILDYSKIEAGKVELHPITCDPGEIVEDVVNLLGPMADEKGLELYALLPEKIDWSYAVDPLRLRQILLNLVSNGVKFTDQGRVAVEMRILPADDVQTDRIEFAVRDSGIGIPAGQRDALFKVFSQLDDSDRRRHGGSGLGLAICKRLVELMGGRIEAVSDPGGGSVFRFEVAFQRVACVLPRPGRDWSGRRIVVVDRFDDRRSHLRRVLESRGAEADCRAEVPVSEVLDVPADAIIYLNGVNGSRPDPGPGGSRPAARPAKTAKLLASRRVLEAVSAGPEAVEIRPPASQRVVVESLARLFLAIEKVEARPIPGRRSESASVPGVGRVLLAEDNATNQRVAAILLERLGIEPVIVADGQEALERCEIQSVDVVLMDIQMPVMDGIEATRRIRRSPRIARQPAIIALTAGAMNVDRANASEVGMDGFLSKPLRLAELRDALYAAKELCAERARADAAGRTPVADAAGETGPVPER